MELHIRSLNSETLGVGPGRLIWCSAVSNALEPAPIRVLSSSLSTERCPRLHSDLLVVVVEGEHFVCERVLLPACGVSTAGPRPNHSNLVPNFEKGDIGLIFYTALVMCLKLATSSTVQVTMSCRQKRKCSDPQQLILFAYQAKKNKIQDDSDSSDSDHMDNTDSEHGSNGDDNDEDTAYQDIHIIYHT